MKKNRILIGTFFLFLSGCANTTTSPPKVVEPVVPPKVEVKYNECSWAKRIELSPKTAEILRPYTKDPEVKADIIQILTHNTQFDVFCQHPD